MEKLGVLVTEKIWRKAENLNSKDVVEVEVTCFDRKGGGSRAELV